MAKSLIPLAQDDDWDGASDLPSKPRQMTCESFLIGLEDAMAEIYPRNKAPCVRTFREHMDRGGHILQVGRSCYTTRASLNAYKQELQSCVDSGRSSRQSGAKRRMAPSIGQRAALSPSNAPMVLSPGGELNLALEETRRRRARRKSTVSTLPTRSGRFTIH